MKDIRAVRGTRLIDRLIAEGEHDHQDFKHSVPDACKIARSISAFANNDGGRLLIGVKDNGRIAGVRDEEDIYVVEQAATLCCRPAVAVTFAAYRVASGATVVVATIPASRRRPVLARDADGSWHAYYRVADENILAPSLMVASWRRLHSRRAAAPITLGPRALALLDIIDRQGHATLRDYLAAVPLTIRDATSTVATLYALRLIDFAYIDRTFRLVRAATAP